MNLHVLKITDELPDVTDRLALLDLRDGQCKWMDGDPKGDHSFCGKPAVNGTSWCQEHYARVFVRKT